MELTADATAAGEILEESAEEAVIGEEAPVEEPESPEEAVIGEDGAAAEKAADAAIIEVCGLLICVLT